MKEMLAKFCHAENIIMNVPWSRGSFSYATNGHILIRVPRQEDVPERTDAPETDGMFAVPEPSAWFPLADMMLPALEVIEKTCPDCNGAGTEEHTCPECDGDGTLEFGNRYHDYEVDCSSCQGEGKIHKCERCAATGKITVQNLQPVRVGGSHFQLRYLLLLKELTNCKIGPSADAMGVAVFRFDGGDGLVMPMMLERS